MFHIENIAESEAVQTMPERRFSQKVIDSIRPYVKEVKERIAEGKLRRSIKTAGGIQYLSHQDIRKEFGLGKTIEWMRQRKCVEAVMINGQPHYRIDDLIVFSFVRDLRKNGKDRHFSSTEPYREAIDYIMHEQEVPATPSL